MVVAQVVDGSSQGEQGEQPAAAEREAADYFGQPVTAKAEVERPMRTTRLAARPRREDRPRQL
jgi:hypothetical protein